MSHFGKLTEVTDVIGRMRRLTNADRVGRVTCQPPAATGGRGAVMH